MRSVFQWNLGSRSLELGKRTLIMGVLNVTPDSFSDGDQFFDPEKALDHAESLLEQGADIIDVGGESTRPGARVETGASRQTEPAKTSAAKTKAPPVTAEEELKRIIPVIAQLKNKHPKAVVSVDTYKAEVAELAVEHGAEIINDPSGLTFDPQLAKTVVQHDAGLVLNHMRGRPETWAKLPPLRDMMGTILRELEATVSRARRAGVDHSRIVIDPGIGFGKRKEQNSEILAQLGQLARLELPLLVGPSRKSFLAQQNEEQTRFATAAAVTVCILAGAHMVRVHDVAEMRAVVRVADEVLRYRTD